MKERFKFCGSCAGSCVAYTEQPDGDFEISNTDGDPARTLVFSKTELTEFARGFLARHDPASLATAVLEQELAKEPEKILIGGD